MLDTRAPKTCVQQRLQESYRIRNKALVHGFTSPWCPAPCYVDPPRLRASSSRHSQSCRMAEPSSEETKIYANAIKVTTLKPKKFQKINLPTVVERNQNANMLIQACENIILLLWFLWKKIIYI